MVISFFFFCKFPLDVCVLRNVTQNIAMITIFEKTKHRKKQNRKQKKRENVMGAKSCGAGEKKTRKSRIPFH